MKNLLIILGILSILIIAGCELLEKEIDTGETECRETMNSIFGALGSELIDMGCQNLCNTEGYSYKQWKCSEKNTLVCVCNKI